MPPRQEGRDRAIASYQMLHQSLLKSMTVCSIVLSVLLLASFLGSLQNFPFYTRTWNRLFICFNGFSLFFSASGLLLFFSSSFPVPLFLATDLENTPLPQAVTDGLQPLAATLPKFLYVKIFLLVSLTSAVVAYACGGLAVVGDSKLEILPTLITCVLGGGVYLQALVVMIRDTLRFLKGIHESNPQLWEATKKETVFGSVLTAYIEHVFKDGRTDARNLDH